MIIIYITADVLIFSFIIIERLLRKGPKAKSMEKTPYDKGSTNFIAFALVISCILVFIAPVMNYYKFGSFNLSITFNLIGILIMVSGLSERVIAALTLGRFYTKTLRTTKNHKIISHGVYKYIRNPGYLGVISLLIGAGISISNIYSIIIISLSVLVSYIYRIRIEERMMIDNFGDEYKDYLKRTKRLLPFIY